MHKEIILLYGVVILIALVNFSCSSSEEKMKESDAVADSLKYLVSIPPGMADVKAEILKCSKETEDFNCKLIILEVFSYGSSTSPLLPGTEIDLYINKNISEEESKKLKEGKVILLRISQIRAPGDKEYWELIRFTK